MNFNVSDRVILKVKHGSHAYGLNVEGSDLDVKGICIEPKEYHFGFAKNFEQHIQEASKGYEHDLVIYSLKKFARLAADCNPNIIEVLFGDDEDVLECDWFGEQIREFRQEFLSLKARYTFAGFAHSQLKRIRTHRAWLLNPPAAPPSRKDFGLPEGAGVSKAELGAFEALVDRDMVGDLGPEALTLYTREKAYKNMKVQWEQYQNWKATRNPKRAELEAKYGYDCYSADTEFLTKNGWKSFDEVLETDALATVRINHDRKDIPFGTLEYQNYTTRFDASYNGPIYQLSGNHVDTRVTANHQMLVCHREKNTGTVYEPKLIQAADLPNCFDIMVAPNPQTRCYKLPHEVLSCGIPHTALLRLIGWYLSDGSYKFRDGYPRSITVSQKKGGRLCQGMNKFSKKYPNTSLYKYTREPTTCRPHEIEEQVLECRIPEVVDVIYQGCGHGSHEKRIPRWVFDLSASNMATLFREMVKGDGTVRKHKTADDSIIYYTVSKGLADDVQELAVRCGWETSLYGPYTDETPLGICTMYQVHVRTSAKQYKTLIANTNVSVETVANQRIVCFTVPNSTLVTRRKGHVSIHGNCKHGSHLIRLMRMCHEILSEGKVYVRRPDRDELLAIKRGEWCYDRLLEEADQLEKECEQLYKTSKVLPKSSDINKIDSFIVDLTDMYLRKKP